MGNTALVYLGPAKVTFGTATPITFDLTKGITLNYGQQTQPVTVDQFGTAPIKEVVTGQNMTVEVTIAESDFAKLTKLIPGSAYDAPSKTLTINNATGVDLLSIADKLVIAPNVTGAFDTITINKAAAHPDFSRQFTQNGEQVYKVTFVAYPDSNNKYATFVSP
jgi:hypothetical protein